MNDQATPVLSDDDIEVLNSARRVLLDARNRTPYTYSGGQCDSMIDTAENGIFMALNWLNASGVQSLESDQLHCRKVVSA